jgi:RNA polymerase sigma-70 factor (ECF subfamily)
MTIGTDCEIQTGTRPLHVANGLTVDDERELVTRARNGSSAAVEKLIERYEQRVFRLVRNITRNHEDAEEVVQNAFVKAFRSLASFRGESRFYTWLVRIAMNEALMKVRRQRFREVSIDDPNEEESLMVIRELEDSDPNPEESYSQEEMREILATTISQLEPGHRIVLRLRDVEGFTTEETARVLGLSISAVKSRLIRARFRLARRVGRLRSAKNVVGNRRPGAEMRLTMALGTATSSCARLLGACVTNPVRELEANAE